MTSLGEIAGAFSGNGEGQGWVINWAKVWVTISDVLATVSSRLIEQAANVVETLSIIGRAFGSLSQGDWSQMDGLYQQMLDLTRRMGESNLHQFDWIQRMIESGVIEHRAAGGAVRAGQPYLVGEQGPELFTPSGSGYVHDAATTAEWGGERTLRVVVESPLPSNRQAIRELALALKREIDLTGAVMVR
jgi:phage-related minor tail protein